MNLVGLNGGQKQQIKRVTRPLTRVLKMPAREQFFDAWSNQQSFRFHFQFSVDNFIFSVIYFSNISVCIEPTTGANSLLGGSFREQFFELSYVTIRSVGLPTCLR